MNITFWFFFGFLYTPCYDLISSLVFDSLNCSSIFIYKLNKPCVLEYHLLETNNYYKVYHLQFFLLFSFLFQVQFVFCVQTTIVVQSVTMSINVLNHLFWLTCQHIYLDHIYSRNCIFSLNPVFKTRFLCNFRWYHTWSKTVFWPLCRFFLSQGQCGTW